MEDSCNSSGKSNSPGRPDEPGMSDGTGASGWPLVLTVELSETVQSWAQALRDRHFPAKRNIVPAHATLFHALPSSCEKQVRDWFSPAWRAPEVIVEKPFLLGRGVAYRLVCPELVSLRATLAGRIGLDRLTRQDRAPWRPHLTVQNKVEPPVARLLHARLTEGHEAMTCQAAALCLWRYIGGPWESIIRLPFCQG